MPRPSAVIFALFALCSISAAQLKTITFEDARKWENLAGAAISADGRWVGYRVAVVDGDPRLIVRNADSPQAKEVVGAGPVSFTDDSQWAAYLISPPKEVADRLRAERKPIKTRLGILNLASGTERIMEDVQRFFFTKGGRYLVAQRYRPESRKDGGSDLTILDMRDGQPLTFGNVSDVIPNDAQDLLALRLESDSGEVGVQIVEIATGRVRNLFWGDGTLGPVAWAGEANVLAYLIGPKDPEKKGNLPYRLVYVTDVRADRPKQATFDPTNKKDFPTTHRITDYALELNETGTVVGFGLQAVKEPKKPTGRPDEQPNVEIWHTKDVRTVPAQKVSQERDRRRTNYAVWRPENDVFLYVSDSPTRSADLLPGGDYALVRDTKPYESAATNGVEYADYTLISTKDSTRKTVLAHDPRGPIPSRTGRYLAYYNEGAWWTYDIRQDKKQKITIPGKVTFLDEDYDGTSPVVPLAAPAEWLKNDDGLVLQDQYDAWLVRPGTASVTRLTDGRKDRVTFRLDEISRAEAEDGVADSGPLHFTMTDEDTKGTGFYETDANGKGKVLFFDAKSSFANFIRAEGADRAIFGLQSFEKSPDLYVTNLAVSQAKPVSKLNAFQKEFYWPKSDLVQYKSRFGKKLDGILIYPANYEKGKTYPMVTYIYEKLSDRYTSYIGPNPWNSYNAQILSQRGYFVLMPDITYLPRNPGKSAVDCLEPALEAVFKLNVGVDPKKVGLMGHSWGGYQTAYVTTVSKMFAVGVAGAPLTELTSMYNSFYWNSGTSDQVLFEISQGRMEVPFWQDPKAYLDNSPVWQSEKRTAPLLLEEGDADGAVDYHQSLYLYQTLRRMGKEAVLLIYPGENHNLSRRPNMLDYGTRVRHFLDVYLKGEKPEVWVTEGVSYLNSKGE